MIPIGRAKIEREGKDVTITAFSIMVGKALQAAEILAEQGIDAEVINLRSIRLLDRHTIIESVKKTNRIVSTEEGWPAHGVGRKSPRSLGSMPLIIWMRAAGARTRQRRATAICCKLEKLALPQVEDIVTAVKKVCAMPIKVNSCRRYRQP